MPGGFHPFHAGHAALYQSARRAFPGARVYVAATNDTSTRPFPFAIKEKLARLAGVQPGHFVQVKSPFRAEEITSQFDPETDHLIFVRSEKDADKHPLAGGVKKNGEPAYLQPLLGAKQLEPFSKHAYMAYLPTVEFGPGMTSATEIRTAWPTLNEKRKTALVMSLYPRTQSNLKLANTVVKLLDAAIGTQDVAEGLAQDEAEEEYGGWRAEFVNEINYNTFEVRVENVRARESANFIIRPVDMVSYGPTLAIETMDVHDLQTGQTESWTNDDPAPEGPIAFAISALFYDDKQLQKKLNNIIDTHNTKGQDMMPGLDQRRSIGQEVDSDSYIDSSEKTQAAMAKMKQGMAENFADGRNPQDKGDAKRHGINTKASVSSLRKTAKQGGRKGQLAHWLANMKSGRAKNEDADSDYIEEKWSSEYKSSINCADPKGFSQKAHCAGRKK